MWGSLPDADTCYSKCTHSLWIRKITLFTVYDSHAQMKSHLIGLWYRQHCSFWTSTDISWLKCLSAYGRGWVLPFFFICTTLTFNLTILTLFLRIKTFFPKNSDFFFSLNSNFFPKIFDFFSPQFWLFLRFPTIFTFRMPTFFLRITILFQEFSLHSSKH